MSDNPSLTVKQCIVPKCTRPQAPSLKRGLCMQCYSKAKKMVELQRTTWEQLEVMGLAKPPVDDPFTEAFNDKTNTTKGD